MVLELSRKTGEGKHAMKRTRAIADVIFAVLIISTSIGQLSQGDAVGSVEGTVLDDAGHAVENAVISIQPEDVQVTGKLMEGRSRKDGKFSIAGVPKGKSFIFAGKPSDGYPDEQYAVFAPKGVALNSIVIEQGKTTADVIVRLPKRGGTITGKIVDFETGRPVLTARIHLYQADDPDRDISTSTNPDGIFNFAVPAIAYKMEVAAPHYKSWDLKQVAESGKDGTMLVPNSSTREIMVRLEKTASSR